MLVLMSNLLTSQTSSTNLTDYKCFPNKQVTEIFKGLKQTEYLKLRLEKTEITLSDAANVINEQKVLISKKDNVINAKDEIITSTLVILDKEKEIRDIQIGKLNSVMELEKVKYKKESRRKFWGGIKIGSAVGIGLSAAAMIFILK